LPLLSFPTRRSSDLHPAHLATIGFNQLVHPVDGLLDGLIVELGPDDVHQLVRRHTTPSFLWDYPAYSRSRRQRSRKAVPSLPEERRGPKPAPATLPGGLWGTASGYGNHRQ